MNKTISIIRIAILAALCAIAFLFLFCKEQDQPMSAFILHVIADKAIAIAIILYVIRLHKRWNSSLKF